MQTQFQGASPQPAARVQFRDRLKRPSGPARRIVHRLRGPNSPASRTRFFEEAFRGLVIPGNGSDEAFTCVTILPNRDFVSTDKP
jgi:hypothetical protein